MTSKLDTLCSYAKSKVAVDTLTVKNYVSTENMIPDKCGITDASSLPSVQYTQQYLRDDVLVSNIRPYFKKIWKAEYDGGCSNDVLVFRAKDDCDPTFLFYLLADDNFFNYATATAKGTKMPRGDKSAIMQYSVPVFDIDTQKKIGALLWSIDQKVRLNNQINENLQQQAQTLFKAWFVDFTPYDGSMPDHWSIVPMSSVARISTEVFSPQKNPNVEVEHYSIPAYDESHYPVFEISDGIKSNKYKLTANSVIVSKLNPDTKRIWRPYCLSNNPICSTEFIVYEPVSSTYRDYVYSIIDSAGFSVFLCSHTTGSTNSRQRVSPSVTLNYNVVLPDEEVLKHFCAIVSPMYETIENNILENQKLTKTRDTLLPKLMSGEIDVSDIDI